MRSLSVFLFVTTLVLAPAFAISLEQVQKEYEKIKNSNADSPSALSNLSRLLCFLGRYEEDEDTKLKYFEEGVELAQKARTNDPSLASATFWWISNRGSIAEVKKNIKALNEISVMEKDLKALKDKSPDYGSGAAQRLLGSLYQNAPGIISIGSTSKAEETLKDAVTRFPNHPSNQAVWLRFLLKEERKDEARETLKKLEALLSDKKTDWGEFGPDELEWKTLITEAKKQLEPTTK